MYTSSVAAFFFLLWHFCWLLERPALVGSSKSVESFYLLLRRTEMSLTKAFIPTLGKLGTYNGLYLPGKNSYCL